MTQAAYETHLPVLKFMFHHFQDIKYVLEMGIGDCSTGFFLKQNIILTSIESDKGWVMKFANQHKNIHTYAQGCHGFVFDKNFDLVFVDGNPANTRHICVQNALPWSRFIVAHDTGPGYDEYKYDRIILPKGWVRLDYKQKQPYTSIFTQDIDAIATIRQKLLGETHV